MSVCADECADVCKCASASQPAGHLGVVAGALLEELPLPPPLPCLVLLAAQIWSRIYFVEFKIFSSGRSHRSGSTLAPQHVPVPSAPGRAAHPPPRYGDSGTFQRWAVGATGRLLPPRPWVLLEPQSGPSLTEEAGDQPRSWEHLNGES